MKQYRAADCARVCRKQLPAEWPPSEALPAKQTIGYQPTLATEIAELQERITSVKGASVTSIQAVYVPADDFNSNEPEPPLVRRPACSKSSDDGH